MSSFREILKEIGEVGPFQRRLIVAVCLPTIFVTFDSIGQVFVGMSYPHRCNTDWILERGPNLTEERQRNLTVPVDRDGNYESCRMFTPVDLDLETIEKYGLNSTTGCVNGFSYEKPEGASSILTEFDLVCDRSSFVSISQSLYMAGVLTGALLVLPLSDRIGRRCVARFAFLSLWVCAIAVAFSPNIYVYMALKFLCALAGPPVYVNGLVIGLEWVDSSRTALLNLLFLVFFPIGLIILSGVAYLIRNWRLLQLTLFCPYILVSVIYFWLLPESARWLLTQGRKTEAIEEINRAAELNGRVVAGDLLEKLEEAGTSRRRNILDIFRTPYLRKRAAVMSFIWFGTSMMYYGLSLNLGSFGLSIYLTQFIFAVVEFPAFMFNLPLTKHLGKRNSLAAMLFLGGLACLGVPAVPSDLPEVVTTIAVIGKCASTAAFVMIYVYSAELYPTVIRQSGLGLNSACARVGGILAPLVPLLVVYHASIHMLVYGAVPVIGGALCFLLPKNENVELEDHMDQSELHRGSDESM